MIKRRPFTMLELICSLALTGVLIVAFGSVLNRLKQAENSFSRETAAILAVQNTLQRLKLEPAPRVEDARRIFREEAALAPGFEPQITETDTELKLALLNHGKAATVEVTLKCAK